MCERDRSLLVIAVFCCLNSINSINEAFDPCKNIALLSHITQRVVGYQLAENELPICDYYLPSGWYSLSHYVLSDTNETCGTNHSWYMADSLPKTGQKVITVCRDQGSDSEPCLSNTTAEVKICDDGHYVFNLSALDECSEAYCIKNLNKEPVENLTKEPVAFDPCKNIALISHITQRVVGYQLDENELPICDYYLPSGWYSLSHYVLSDTNETCGTNHSWYMADSLPKTGQKVITVCRDQGSDSEPCLSNTTAEVKICDDGHYVFNLSALDECSEAYCIRNPTKEPVGNPTKEPVENPIKKPEPVGSTPPDMTNFRKPELIVKAVKQGAAFQLEFYCDITPLGNKDYFYVVEWSLTTGTSQTRSIKLHREVKYVNQTDFRSKTFMSEADLRHFGIQTLGFSVICSVKAKNDTGGLFGAVISSNVKFCGVEASIIWGQHKVESNNKSEIVKGNGHILLELGKKSSKDIELRLTVPFGCPGKNCELIFGLFSTELNSCTLSQVAIGKNDRKPCGIRFFGDEINQYKKFKVVAQYGEKMEHANHIIRLKSVPYPDHKIFGDYQLDPIIVEILEQRILNGKRCFAHSDPHMLTFDGRKFDYQYEGKFILYRNRDRNTEVQIQTKRCFENHEVYCICSLVVRAGRDIYSIEMCDGTSVMDQDFRMCDDKLLKGKVQRETNAKKYVIILPTGTVVEAAIGTYVANFIDVDIIPSAADINQTEGLCGNFDQNAANDWLSGKDLSFSVKEDLFDRSNYAGLKSYNEQVYLCTCRQTGQELIPESVCDTSQRRQCSYGSRKPVDDHGLCSLNRKKRSVVNQTSHELDRHFSAETSFSLKAGTFAKTNVHQRNLRHAPIYTKSEAKENCIRLINTTVVQKCSGVPNLDLALYVENCVSDAMVSNSMNWTIVHLEGFKSKCIHDVRVNQPLPNEALEELQQLDDLVNNATSSIFNDGKIYESGTETMISHTTPAIGNVYSNFNFTTALFDEIRFASCPNECNGRGKCVQGKCVCETDYIGFDCSVDADKPPEMIGIPDKGLCDTRKRLCLKTSVFAKNLVESPAVSCQVSPFKIDLNERIAIQSSIKTVTSMESYDEVICQLPAKRSRRSPVVVNKNIAHGYDISVSNDGVLYSEEDTIVIFDSNCVNCTNNGDGIACFVKSGYCVNDGSCYKKSDSIGCNICGENINGSLQWMHTKECDTVTRIDEQANKAKLWIIGAVFGPLICFIIIAIFICRCHRSRKYANRQKEPGSYNHPTYDMQTRPAIRNKELM